MPLVTAVLFTSSDGKETLMNRTDKRNDTGFSARKLGQQSWTDGQMFVLVYMETNPTVFTQSGTEGGPSQLTGGNSKHSIPKGQPEEKKKTQLPIKG